MPVFSRKGIDCPQCAEFKPRVQINSAWHLQRTLCHLENAVSLGILRDVGKEADPKWGNSLAECRALGDERERFGWYDSLSLCFEFFYFQAASPYKESIMNPKPVISPPPRCWQSAA